MKSIQAFLVMGIWTALVFVLYQFDAHLYFVKSAGLLSYRSFY